MAGVSWPDVTVEIRGGQELDAIGGGWHRRGEKEIKEGRTLQKGL